MLLIHRSRAAEVQGTTSHLHCSGLYASHLTLIPVYIYSITDQAYLQVRSAKRLLRYLQSSPSAPT